MGTRRTLIIIVAVIFAAVAAFANYAYLNSVQDRAYDNAERVRVFVVREDIAKGASGEQAISNEWIRRGEIPKEFVPTSALDNINTIRGMVAINKLSAGQVVVEGMFVNPSEAAVTAAQRIPAGRATVTVSVDQIAGVSGLLQPGDRVNLLILDTANNQRAERVLYQNVEILFVGGVAAPQPGETQAPAATTSGVITFSVPPEAVSRIAFAATKEGGVYLSLVPPDNQPVPIPPITDGNLYNVPLTPYG